VAYKIFFTEDALADLEDILNYIRRDSEPAAENFGVAILDHVELLREFPHIGTMISPPHQKDPSLSGSDLLSG
jgi:plasmid stabilization system protein ParE